MRLFKNRTVVGMICIMISLFICFGITPLFNQGISKKIEIVRVAKDIKTGDKITKDKLLTIEVGSYNLPKNVIKLKDTVIGSYALADLSMGDYILNSKVSKTPSTENTYLYNLDGSKQAISITIKSFANGLSGKLQSGDIVSVIAADYKKLGATVIPAELRYVEVISVTASSGYDANTGEEDDSKDERELPSTVTLLVTPEQANILASLEADGESQLSLVYRGVTKNTKKFLDMQSKTLEELYPVEKITVKETLVEREKIRDSELDKTDSKDVNTMENDDANENEYNKENGSTKENENTLDSEEE